MTQKSTQNPGEPVQVVKKQAAEKMEEEIDDDISEEGFKEVSNVI